MGPGMKRTCTAHRSDGQPCGAAAIAGGTVCRLHGGSAPQVRDAARQRLLKLVDPALGRLDQLIRVSEDERIVLAAVREVLTRAGIDPAAPEWVITGEMMDAAILRLKTELDQSGLLNGPREALP